VSAPDPTSALPAPTAAVDLAPAVQEADAPADDATAGPWQRLDSRVIWVDLAQSVLSTAPAVVAVTVFDVEATWSTLWPFLLAGAWGVLGAVGDAVRWAFTRYRITDDYVERRTGVLVRRYRSVRRDRIRSIDVTARLRHRLAGLRVVLVGAGQQVTSGESALSLDALHRRDAVALRRRLLGSEGPGAPDAVREQETDPVVEAADAEAAGAGAAGAGPDPRTRVLARLRPWWVVYNVLGIWGFVTAAGLFWGAYWFASTFGLDLADWALERVGPERIGWTGTVLVALAGAVLLGTVGMACSFFATSWRFELARVPGPESTQLRTRAGLLTTREVNRDVRRLRGVTISEPVLWRWIGMADTLVVTTGLSIWSTSQPASILPRGPVSVARRVASEVLDETPDPFDAPLTRHPAGALRRRLWWATATAGILTAVLWWLVAQGALPAAVLWVGAGAWLLGLVGAVVAYRALGHTVSGAYMVVRSGLAARSTTALRRDAVSTIAVRESILQRRLGLRTVSAMTAAGWGVYEAPDVAASEAVAFAATAAPGLLDAFVEPADG
jgi:putative membrane protein